MEPANVKVEDVQSIVNSVIDTNQEPTNNNNNKIEVPRETGNALQNAIAQIIEDILNNTKIKTESPADTATVNKLIDAKLAGRAAPVTVTIDNKKTGVVTHAGVQHKQFPNLLRLIQCGYPVWLPGPAGSGKTTAAMNVAKALGLPFHHNGAIDTEYKLLGFTDAAGRFHETPFYRAYKDGGVYLFDEVDASNPQALVALNAALENGHCFFGNGECVPKHENFHVIAAANTYGAGATHEYVGRNKLDAATVDRFIMLAWEYDEELERHLANNDAWVAKVQSIRAKVKAKGVKHVVSPRASIRGAALLAAGFSEAEALDMVVYKGLSDDQRRSLASTY